MLERKGKERKGWLGGRDVSAVQCLNGVCRYKRSFRGKIRFGDIVVKFKLKAESATMARSSKMALRCWKHTLNRQFLDWKELLT